MEDTSPLYVDGQRTTCDLDGLAISCSQVRNRLENGSVVPPLINGILRAAGGRDINLQYTGGGRFTFRDFDYDGPGRRSIGLTFNFLVNFGTQPQTRQSQTNTAPNTESAASSSSDCDSHEKFLLREDVLGKFQAAWDDSHFGEEGKQQEQGGMIFGERSGTTPENVDFKDERYSRIEGEWAHMLQFWQKFSSDTLASMSSDYQLRYIYHSHPFKKGVPFRYRGRDKLVEFSSQSEANIVSNDDYDLLKGTNTTNSGVFGVLLTNEGIRVYNDNKVICDFKVIWKPRSSAGSGVLPRH